MNLIQLTDRIELELGVESVGSVGEYLIKLQGSSSRNIIID